MIPFDFGLPTIDGKAAFGASSPEKPALHIPEPLSITTPYDSSSSSDMFNFESFKFIYKKIQNRNLKIKSYF